MNTVSCLFHKDTSRAKGVQRFIYMLCLLRYDMCPNNARLVNCGGGRVAQCNSLKSCRSPRITWVRIPSAAPYHPLPNGTNNSMAIVSWHHTHDRRLIPIPSLIRHYLWVANTYVSHRYKGFVALSSKPFNMFIGYKKTSLEKCIGGLND